MVAPTSPIPPTQPDRLLSGQGLLPGQSLTSPSGAFQLLLQTDGNLVESSGGNGALADVWTSRTGGNVNIFDAVMQQDGNFVLYNTDGDPLFATGTEGNIGATLFVQDDGNVVIYTTEGVAVFATAVVI